MVTSMEAAWLAGRCSYGTVSGWARQGRTEGAGAGRALGWGTVLRERAVNFSSGKQGGKDPLPASVSALTGPRPAPGRARGQPVLVVQPCSWAPSALAALLPWPVIPSLVSFRAGSGMTASRGC